MTFTLETDDGEREATEEQAAIIDYALGQGRRNLLINALAGAAKTTTLRFLCKYMPSEPTLSLAFNKRIADEMSKVLPPHVRCATMNSVGHRVWGAAIGKRLTLDTKKNYNIIKAYVDGLPKAQRWEAYEIFGDLVKAIGRAKLSGYIPPEHKGGKSLLTEVEFFDSLEEAPDDWFKRIVNQSLLEGIKQAYAGLIDFDDQIYMPTLFGGSFPQHKQVLGDESQDFSRLNQAMLEQLINPDTWFAGVGDPNQSIYAFRGADTKSMAWLAHRFDMHEMPLSVSFRCPITVVKNAHKHVPHMRWPSWAKEGRVATMGEWSAAGIPEDAAIVCRNNAPLMKCALNLLRNGRGVHLVGTDLGPQLVKALKKLSDNPELPRLQVYTAIDRWEADKLQKSRNAAAVADRAECLRVFAGFGKTLHDAINYCEGLFGQRGTIQLMSGHKAKGLEFDTTIHLDPHRIPSPWSKTGEDLEQEKNVEYVIETRSKENLFFARLDEFTGETE